MTYRRRHAARSARGDHLPLREETGVDLTGIGSLRPFDLRVRADSAGHAIDLRHQGLIADVQVAGSLRVDIAAEDVDGVALGDSHTTERLSPLATEALRLFPAYALPAGDDK